ncbi:MAG: patatin-like phospholipase family protein [Syntrophobacteraceae bacterium]
MAGNLVFHAGEKAMEAIEREGLRPAMVKAVLGAAGGPKWLVLYGLDRAIFGSWLQGRSETLSLLGASIGAWRFAAASLGASSEGLDRFLSLYMGQGYSPYPDREEISSECVRMLDALLGGSGVAEILDHPFLRLSILAVRCKWPVKSDNKVLLSLGLMDAAVYNAVHRGGLRLFFERTLFFDPRTNPPLGEISDFETIRAPLSEKNLKEVLLASGAVPLVMSGIRDIAGAPPGMYRDGGILDYHFDLPVLQNGDAADGVILFPHYTNRIVPGWFDKRLPWRKPRKENLARMLMVSPSKRFIENLPLKKIPDREDFPLFRGRDEERIAYWNAVVEAGRRLGEEFLEAVETGGIRKLLQPIEEI